MMPATRRKEAVMKRTSIALVVIFSLGIVVGGLGHQRLSAQPEPVTRTVLLRVVPVQVMLLQKLPT
jgi:hypothetical protein